MGSVYHYTLSSFSPEKLRTDVVNEAKRNGVDHYRMMDFDLNVGKEEMRARMIPARRDIKSRKSWYSSEMDEIFESAAAYFDLPKESIIQAYESIWSCMSDASKTYDFPAMVVPGFGHFNPRLRKLESYKLRLEANYVSSVKGSITAKLVTPESYRRRAIAIQLSLQRHYHEGGLVRDPINAKRPIPTILEQAYRDLRSKEVMREINQRFLKPTKKSNSEPRPKN